jgi:hypothetical protein
MNSTSTDDISDIDVSPSNDGFAPTEDNFSRILPTKEGLIIYFGEYQIGPYVYGPQEALIPYTALRTIINKDGVLGEYVK